jgi:hypothetical protein
MKEYIEATKIGWKTSIKIMLLSLSIILPIMALVIILDKMHIGY